MNDVFFKECEVKKTNQYDALKVWKFLEVSKQLYLFREKEDEKEYVFLYYKLTEEEKETIKEPEKIEDLATSKIGFLSEEDATPINKFLKARQTGDLKDDNYADDLFECIISKCDKKADEDKRISVAIFIKKSSSPQK
ncbi:MAG: hypothetical protein WCR36_10260 [Bacteroidaceae bacterium]